MTKEKKEPVKCDHRFIVTASIVKGGHKSATQMRCSRCLKPVSLEELESKEWRESQGF